MTALALPLPEGHAGHLLVSLPVYLGPVVVLVVALKLADRRERRRRQQH